MAVDIDPFAFTKPNCYIRRLIRQAGDVAQLGERMNGIHEVRGSIPLVSTNLN